MFSKSAHFDKSLEKATSQLLLEPDWDSILQICDCIRQGDVQAKYAVGSLKRKISIDNPHVCMFALQTLESCVKNCGSTIHDEVATKEFMEFLKDLAKNKPDPVKGKVCEMIQCWSHAFRNEPNYKVVQDTFNLMKMEGYTFPTLKEADAMFSSERAPDWKEGDNCTRCRTKFGMMNRQHHCRSCGDVFCGRCSSKTSIIPKFGIEKEVRVCDACYDKIQQPAKKKEGEDLPAEYLSSPLSKQKQTPPQKSEQEIQEEEELQLALALSQSEDEAKQKERDRLRKNYGMYGGGNTTTSSAPSTTYTQPAPVSAPMIDTDDMDPELARYLNRNYWQQKSEDIKTNPSNTNIASTTTPSAPVATTEPKQAGGKVVLEAYQNGADENDQEQFLRALNSSLEIFVNRMRSNSQRGRSIATDSSVQSLFNVISNMHPQLMKYTQEQEDMRAHYESLQDKLAQLRDAREALDALREDHREKRRREQEELERQRQIQMAQKLEIMRQKKHEYLEMQRQLALQRLQEQEREMQMRFEQQKQLTQMRQMQAYGYPQQGYGQMPSMPGIPQQAFSPDGSPIHQVHGGYAPPMGMGNIPGGGIAPGMGMDPSNMGMGGPMVGMQPPPNQQQVPPMSYAPTQSGTNITGGQSQYQPPPVSTSYSNLPGSYQTEGGTNNYQQYSMSPPTSGGPPPPVSNPAYMPQQNMDYPAYNMQSMANALPQQGGGYGGPTPPQQSNQYMSGGGNQSGQYQPPNQGGPPTQYQQPMQGTPQSGQYQPGGPQQHMAPPPATHAPPQSTLEAELISFD